MENVQAVAAKVMQGNFSMGESNVEPDAFKGLLELLSGNSSTIEEEITVEIDLKTIESENLDNETLEEGLELYSQMLSVIGNQMAIVHEDSRNSSDYTTSNDKSQIVADVPQEEKIGLESLKEKNARTQDGFGGQILSDKASMVEKNTPESSETKATTINQTARAENENAESKSTQISKTKQELGKAKTEKSIFSQVMPQESKTSEFKEPILLENKNEVSLDHNLEKIQTSVLRMLETSTEGDTSKMTVRLEPESLGKVDLDLRMENGKLTARIVVENTLVKDILDARLTELTTGLQKQDIQVEKINIEVNQVTENLEFDMGQQGGFRDSHNRQNWQKTNSIFRELEAVKSIRKADGTNEGLSILA